MIYDALWLIFTFQVKFPPPSPMIDVAHVPFVYNYHCQNNKKTDEIFDKNLHIKNHISKVGK